MTEEELARKREINRLYAERKRREKGVPVAFRYADETTRKEERRKKLNEWRAANREHYNAQANVYREKHREAILERQRARYWSDPEKARQAARDWMDKRREEVNARRREAYAKNPLRHRANAAKWYAANPEKAAACSHKWYVEHKEIVHQKNLSRYYGNHQATLNNAAQYKLAKGLQCSTKEVPAELLEAKLAFLNVKRQIKEMKK